MKPLFALLLLLSLSFQGYATTLQLISIPPGVTMKEALLDLKQAAKQRGWKVIKGPEKRLTIQNTSKHYRAKLVFTALNGRISYIDKTKRYSHTSHNKKVFKDSTVPDKWLRNLKYDATVFMYKRTSLSPTPDPEFRAKNDRLAIEDAQKRLRGLKAMRDEKLISEAEYHAKKQDILSRY